MDLIFFQLCLTSLPQEQWDLQENPLRVEQYFFDETDRQAVSSAFLCVNDWINMTLSEVGERAFANGTSTALTRQSQPFWQIHH